MSDGPQEDNAPEMPALIKQLAWLWHHTRTNRKLLVKGPVLAFAAITAVTGFWVGSTRENEVLKVKEETLSTKNERINFLEDQLSAYRDRLQGATPDEAAKRFSALENKIAEQNKKIALIFPDKTRTLDEGQKNKLRNYLDNLKKDIKLLILFAYPVGDSTRFANDFYSFFKSNNLPLLGVIASPCDDTQRGILVGVLNPDKPSEAAQDFIKVLSDAGLRPAITKWEIDVPTTQDFDLFICPGVPINPQGTHPEAPILPSANTEK
jgi:hypothetical protein